MSTFYKRLAPILCDLKFFDDINPSIADTELFAASTLKVISTQKGGVLIIAENSAEIDRFGDDLKVLLQLTGDKREILEFPEFHQSKGLFQPDNDSERNVILAKLLKNADDYIILTSLSALIGNVPSPEGFQKSSFEISVGDEGREPEDLARLLVDMDYDNEYQVNLPGEFARRGGIVDIFSPVYNVAHRIEFFGDEIDSIRSFDPQTQRSIEDVAKIEVVPRAGQNISTGRLIDYCPHYTTVLIDAAGIHQHAQNYFGDKGAEILEHSLNTCQNTVNIELKADSKGLGIEALAPFYRSMLPETDGVVTMLHRQFVNSQLEKWTSTGCDVYIFCGSKGNRQRLEELLKENKKIVQKRIFLDDAALSNGFFITETRTAVVSENEIFGRVVTVRKPRSAKQRALEAFLEEEPEIGEGDYAVHLSHGICRYHGISIQENGGVSQEVMILEFADERKLYVPLDSAHLVSRYIGGRKGVPKLSKIGGVTWKNAKLKAEDAASDFAADMLRMQAMRHHAKGHRTDDTPRTYRSLEAGGLH